MEFKTIFGKWTSLINDTLADYIIERDTPEGNIYRAMNYSLMAGGKRLRPVLALAVTDMLEGSEKDILPFACAIEMIHTYSLIHDDLPAMDNDDYRRGRPTSHKVFGEAMAILAGDALLNRAFEIMLENISTSNAKIREKIKAMEIIARSSGANGMIGGQVVDLESEKTIISADRLEYMHRYKTGALLKAPVLAAATICGIGEKEYKLLDEYAQNIGLAFQIKDDIMNVESSLEEMGKPAGSDAVNGKSTFITLYGIAESKKILNHTVKSAIKAIEPFGEKAEFLKALAAYIEERND